MENSITGTIILIQTPTTGEGKNGTWTKNEFVIETEGDYPKKILFSLFNKPNEIPKIQPRARVNVFFNLESREYNGRYFTDAQAWKIEQV